MPWTHAFRECVLKTLRDIAPSDLGIEDMPTCNSPEGHNWIETHSLAEFTPVAMWCTRCGLAASI